MVPLREWRGGMGGGGRWFSTGKPGGVQQSDGFVNEKRVGGQIYRFGSKLWWNPQNEQRQRSCGWRCRGRRRRWRAIGEGAAKPGMEGESSVLRAT